MQRTILHCDMNNFYASVECMLDRSLRGHPVAVGGDPENRHGIILAKNYEAKKFGIRFMNYELPWLCCGSLLHMFHMSSKWMEFQYRRRCL